METLPGGGVVSSGPGPSPNCLCNAGCSTALGESLASADPGYGVETARPVAAPEDTSPGKASASPSKAAPWTPLFLVGTQPHPQHRHLGLRELARQLLCEPPFCPDSPRVLHSAPSGTSGQSAQREPLFGVQGLPTRSPDWLEPNTGRTRGRLPWDLPWAATVGQPPGCGPYSVPPVLRAGAGLADSRVSECVFPAFDP